MSEHSGESRRDPGVERLILFSDAVFAISITLTLLEVKPNTSLSAPGALLAALGPLSIYAYSFAVIASYWTVHHRLFRDVIRDDRALVSYNFLVLFFVSLIPFTTSFFNDGSPDQERFYVYGAGIGLVGFSLYLLWKHVAKPGSVLLDRRIDPPQLRRQWFYIARVFAIPLICLGPIGLWLVHTNHSPQPSNPSTLDLLEAPAVTLFAVIVVWLATRGRPIINSAPIVPHVDPVIASSDVARPAEILSQPMLMATHGEVASTPKDASSLADRVERLEANQRDVAMSRIIAILLLLLGFLVGRRR